MTRCTCFVPCMLLSQTLQIATCNHACVKFDTTIQAYPSLHTVTFQTLRFPFCLPSLESPDKWLCIPAPVTTTATTTNNNNNNLRLCQQHSPMQCIVDGTSPSGPLHHCTRKPSAGGVGVDGGQSPDGHRKLASATRCTQCMPGTEQQWPGHCSWRCAWAVAAVNSCCGAQCARQMRPDNVPTVYCNAFAVVWGLGVRGRLQRAERIVQSGRVLVEPRSLPRRPVIFTCLAHAARTRGLYRRGAWPSAGRLGATASVRACRELQSTRL